MLEPNRLYELFDVLKQAVTVLDYPLITQPTVTVLDYPLIT